MTTITAAPVAETTTTITESRHSARRPRILGVAVALTVALVTGACSGDGTEAATVTSSTPAPVARTTAPPGATQTSRPQVDPAAALADALAAYAGGYSYRVTAEVNGQTASVIEGRTLDGAAAFTVSSGDAAVDYIVTGEGRWVRSVGSEWNLLDEAPLQNDPLLAMSTPAALELASQDGDTVVLRATYPALALGTTGDDIVADLTILDGLLVEARYGFSSQGVVAAVVTEFRPIDDLTPITPPVVEG